MGASDSASSDTEAEILEGGIRALQGNELADEGELVAEHGEDALVAGARSIADIDKIMAELQMARDYLQSEAERVRRVQRPLCSFGANRVGFSQDHRRKFGQLA